MPRMRNFQPTNRSGSWVSLGSETMLRLFDFGHENNEMKMCELGPHKIANSACGGLMAVYPSLKSGDNCVYLLTSACTSNKVCPSIRLADKENVTFMCWTRERDHLLVATTRDVVHFFDYHGNTVHADVGVPRGSLYSSHGSGFIVVIGSGSELVLTSLEYSESLGYTTKNIQLPSNLQQIWNISVLAIPQAVSYTGCTEAFLAYKASSVHSDIFHVTFTASPRCNDLKVAVEGGKVNKMTLAPSGNALCLLMENGSLYCANRAFDEIVCVATLEAQPTQLAWCGENSVAYVESDDTENDEIPSVVYAVSVLEANPPEYIGEFPADVNMLVEPDGIRLIARECNQFMQVVPPEAQRIFAVGSRASSAMLRTAFDEFLLGNAAAVKMVREFQSDQGMLTAAINDCITTAGFELDIFQQKRMLRIAEFGRSFSSAFNSDALLTAARRLRVRNTLRTSSVSITISDVQMAELGDEQLVERLVKVDNFQVAYSVANALALDTERIICDWAVAKLTRGAATGENEKAVAKGIASKIRRLHVSFTQVAKVASLCGKRQAALVLLEQEHNAFRLVPMLLSINEPELALKKAVVAGYSDLVFTAMNQLLRARGKDAIPIIAKNSLARNLFTKYAMTCGRHQPLLAHYIATENALTTEQHLLRYLHDDNRLVASLSNPRGGIEWQEAQELKSNKTQSASIAAKKEAELTPLVSSPTTKTEMAGELELQSKYIKLQAALVEEQTQLMRQFDDKRFLTGSAGDLVRLALEHGQTTIATRLKTQFGVSDKMFQWCMLSAFCATGEWDRIDQQFSADSKTKSLISPEALVTMLLSHKRTQQAKRYISRVPRIEQRMEFYVQCGDWNGAGADCRRNVEPDLLAQLKERAKGNTDALQQIETGWNSQSESAGAKFTKLFSST